MEFKIDFDELVNGHYINHNWFIVDSMKEVAEMLLRLKEPEKFRITIFRSG